MNRSSVVPPITIPFGTPFAHKVLNTSTRREGGLQLYLCFWGGLGISGGDLSRMEIGQTPGFSHHFTSSKLVFMADLMRTAGRHAWASGTMQRLLRPGSLIPSEQRACWVFDAARLGRTWHQYPPRPPPAARGSQCFPVGFIVMVLGK